ncbi:transcriptional regulator NrdR [soil metagenome]
MYCPSCGHQTRTLETRRAEDGAAVRRRRSCPGCGSRFTTFERRAPEPAWVVKRGGERQAFDAAKLRAAIGRAAHKRPVTPAQLDAIVGRIELAAERAEGSELTSERVRDLCLEGLGEIDAGAYLQFAGVELSDFGSVRAALERFEARKVGDPLAKTADGSVRDGEDSHSSETDTR